MTARDDFPGSVKQTLAKRVGFHCSNPACRQGTTGPREEPSGTVNIGVAAHIAAAAEGGPRYDPSMTPEQRRSIANGIWLCQNCAKLIDSDETYHDAEILHQWKSLAEKTATKELQTGRSHDWDAEIFQRLEHLMPELLAEMREDLLDRPLAREFVLLSSKWIYNSRGPYLAYHYENYPDLEDIMVILGNYDLIQEITFNNVKRYVLSEKLVRYLLNE